MQGESPVPALTVDQRRVHQASLIRGLMVCAAWLITWPLRHFGGEVRLGLDVALALAGWWAMLPGRQAGGKLFGEGVVAHGPRHRLREAGSPLLGSEEVMRLTY
jgi:hypothetical protein